MSKQVAIQNVVSDALNFMCENGFTAVAELYEPFLLAEEMLVNDLNMRSLFCHHNDPFPIIVFHIELWRLQRRAPSAACSSTLLH